MKKPICILSLALGLIACGDGQAEERQPPVPPGSADSLSEFSVCRMAWEQNEEELDASDKQGNPYSMLDGSAQTWRFEAEWQGHRFHIIPAEYLGFQVELSGGQTASGRPGKVACQVPIAWKALDTNLGVSSDVKFHDSRKITMINGKPFGNESKGGIYIRHYLVASDLHDVNVAWFLNSPELSLTGAESALREDLNIPSEQTLTIIKAAEFLKDKGSYPLEGLALTVGTEPIKHWALLPVGASTSWSGLKFLPFGTPTAEATVEAAWNASKILDLAVFNLWDVGLKKATECTSFATPPKIACRQIVDDAFYKVFAQAQLSGADVCAHLAWKGQGFGRLFVSTFCVNSASGAVSFMGSKRLENMDGLEWAAKF